jgi:hypothetical protein
MLGVWLGNTRLAKEHPEEFLKLGIKLTICMGILFIIVAMTQDFARDCLRDFIEWTCSFNGTLDVEVLWEQIKNSIGMK